MQFTGGAKESEARMAKKKKADAGGEQAVERETLLPFTLAADDEAYPESDRMMTSPLPPEPPPSLDELRSLYRAAEAFKEIEPWDWMVDADIFGVRNPEDGTTGYCCVMGALGVHYALAVYRGGRGYESWKRIRKEGQAKHPDFEIAYLQDCLMASWEDRGELERADLGAIKALGLKYRGHHAWPLFRDHRPGYVPWHLSGRGARFLTVALEQARGVALRFQRESGLLAPRKGKLLVRAPGEKREQWTDEWMSPEPAPLPSPAVGLDEVRVRRIREKLEPDDSTWQADRFCLPASVADPRRPFFPVLFLAVEADHGIIVGQGMNHPEETPYAIRDHLLTAFEQWGALPKVIRVMRPGVFDVLQPLAAALGVKLEMAKSLRAVNQARKGLEQFLASRG